MDQQVCKQTPPSHLDFCVSNFYVAEQPRTTQQGRLRPPLSKKMFPVFWVGKKRPVGRSESFFFFFLFFFSLECTGGGGVENNLFFENMKKIVPVGPF